MATHSVTNHRVLRTSPDRVYRAFLEAEALTKRLPPHRFTGMVHHLEARVGGSYRMSFTNFGTGESRTFGGTYLELIPGKRIRNTDQFDDSGCNMVTNHRNHNEAGLFSAPTSVLGLCLFFRLRLACP